MQTASGHHGPDIQELVFGKIMRTNFECRMKHQYSPYCNSSVLIETLKPAWPWTQMIVQRFCSGSKGRSLRMQQLIAADACRQTSVLLHVRDTNLFSTRKTLTANKHDLLAYTTLNCHTALSETCSTFVLDWALYPARFRQYLSLLHQQQKYFSLII